MGDLMRRLGLIAAMLTGMAGLVAAPPAAARPAHFVEPFENGVTVGLALPCPQPRLPIVATVHWSNSAPRQLTAKTCSGPAGEGAENDEVKWAGSKVDLYTGQWGPPSEPGEPPSYPVGPRLFAEAEVNPHRHHAKWVIFFQLAEGDTYLESGTIFLYSKYVPPRRVWQSEKESFVNVCVTMHKKITSINHRRGCYLPPTVFATEKVRWSHR
jgi:hypothetical protein